jgi:hypothetical protein
MGRPLRLLMVDDDTEVCMRVSEALAHSERCAPQSRAA